VGVGGGALGPRTRRRGVRARAIGGDPDVGAAGRRVLQAPRSAGGGCGPLVSLQILVIVVNIFNGIALQLDVPFVFYFILIPPIAVATMIPVSLNGLGVREGAFVFFLAQVGVPEAQALSLALLWLGVLIASSLIGGLVWLATPAPPKPVEAGNGLQLDPESAR
jgi:uncharacterized membrane protein YbhN (UPF0104 family)